MNTPTTASKFSRFSSLREKRRSHVQARTAVSDLSGLFILDENAKKPSKEEEKKIQEIRNNLHLLGNPNIPEARIEYALRAKFVNGDIAKAQDLIQLFEDSIAGVIRPPEPKVRMLGAENREKSTCYLDALLFAMFAKTNVFEAILYNAYEDEAKKRLVMILRVWVNLLRTGRLITTDITRNLQESLAECGWADAAKIRQQDTSEAFCFIADKLNMPLLTLKSDLFHSGKEDVEDDHKFIGERLLDVGIPENVPEGQSVTLERCLEEYFDNKVEVRRELQRRATFRKGSAEKSTGIHVDVSEVDPQAESPLPLESPVTPLTPGTFGRPAYLRERAQSIFSERRVDLTPTEEKTPTDNSEHANPKAQNATVKKEVLLPAWQFLNLIPWYTDNSRDQDIQVRAHFSSRRPMLGICLKRYTVSKTGSPIRLSTKVDVPLEMGSPHFADEDAEAHGIPTSELQLVLQSVVCHRGIHVNSGHYICLVRDTSEPGDNRWIRHDDLALERVTVVDIHKALKEESPYVLFYAVKPVSGPESDEELPPYAPSESALSTIGEKLAALQDTRRPSLEVQEQMPDRNSIGANEESQARSSFGDAGWSSVVYTSDNGSINASSGIKTEQTSTAPTTPSEDTKNSSLSTTNRSARQSRSSRPSMESNDRRLLSRIGSKLLLRERPASIAVSGAEFAITDEKPSGPTSVTVPTPRSAITQDHVTSPESFMTAKESPGPMVTPHKHSEKELEKTMRPAANEPLQATSLGGPLVKEPSPMAAPYHDAQISVAEISLETSQTNIEKLRNAPSFKDVPKSSATTTTAATNTDISQKKSSKPEANTAIASDKTSESSDTTKQATPTHRPNSNAGQAAKPHSASPDKALTSEPGRLSRFRSVKDQSHRKSMVGLNSSHSRRSSGSKPQKLKSKKPERDCIVM